MGSLILKKHEIAVVKLIIYIPPSLALGSPQVSPWVLSSVTVNTRHCSPNEVITSQPLFLHFQSRVSKTHTGLRSPEVQLCRGHSGTSGAGRDLQTPAVLDMSGASKSAELYSVSICFDFLLEGPHGDKKGHYLIMLRPH